MPDYTESEIKQTYLATAEDGVTERVRQRVCSGVARFYHTVKQRIDKMSCKEDEREITEAEYRALILRSDAESRPIEKTRYTFSCGALTVEIDKYALWDNIAVLEVELPSRETVMELPGFVEVLFEATGNFAFSNASLSKKFPTQEEVVSTYL
jgi:CYTH domain-containing protein